MEKLKVMFVLVLGMLAYSAYQKSGHSEMVKEQFLQICNEDAVCEAAVDEHFRECFNRYYHMASHRKSAQLNQIKALSCINSNTGKPVFELNK